MVSCRCVYIIIAGHRKGEFCYCRASTAVKRGTEKQPFSHRVSERGGERQ